MMRSSRVSRTGGFTLVELLVVILIVLLVSAVTLPTVLPALNHRQVSEAARILQAALVGAHDAAIRAHAPRGIRLLPDPVLTVPNLSSAPVAGHPPGSSLLAYNRLVPIEQPGDYNSGLVSIIPGPYNSPYPGTGGASPYPSAPGSIGHVLRVEQSAYTDQIDPSTGSLISLMNEPTSWWWNIRVGDRIRLGDSGRFYTIVGPLVVNPFDSIPPGQNPELFVNEGQPGTASSLVRNYATATNIPVEYLLLVNGKDDNGDGYTDEGWDGIDNPSKATANFGTFDGVPDDLSEWEEESWAGSMRSGFVSFLNKPYVINRVRPLVNPSARETFLPGDVVVDATSSFSVTSGTTTIGATYERSRLPIDRFSLNVDIMLNPNGTVIPTTLYSSPASMTGLPFYHFWLSERADVHEFSQLWGPDTPNPNSGAGQRYMLPMPENTPNYSPTTPLYLTGERRLLTLFPKTGQIVTNSIELFNGLDINTPYYEAQLGAREAK